MCDSSTGGTRAYPPWGTGAEARAAASYGRPAEPATSVAAVAVGAGEAVGPEDDTGVLVKVARGVKEAVAVNVAVGLRVSVAVAVLGSVEVAVGVNVAVAVGEGVGVPNSEPSLRVR